MDLNKKIRLTKENARNYIGKTIEFTSSNAINKRVLLDVGGGVNTCNLKVDFPTLGNRLVIWHNDKTKRAVYVIE